MNNCTFNVVEIVKDNITGEVRKRIVANGEDKFNIWNKNNDCKYFKKRVFSKVKALSYCKDCKYWKKENDGGFW